MLCTYVFSDIDLDIQNEIQTSILLTPHTRTNTQTTRFDDDDDLSRVYASLLGFGSLAARIVQFSGSGVRCSAVTPFYGFRAYAYIVLRIQGGVLLTANSRCKTLAVPQFAEPRNLYRKLSP